MQNVEKTIISQYANSPILCQLIKNMNQYIDQTANFQAFYDFIWNVDTAQGFGLDIWGRIVDVGRTLKIPDDSITFGFSDEADDYAPFDQAPFVSDGAATSAYSLSDEAYRSLILVKALANISATTAPALNQLLSNFFADRGRCYVLDLGSMQARYVFEFSLEPFERVIVQNFIPRPAGVFIDIYDVDVNTTFGFAQSVNLQPFNHGVFSQPL